MYSQVDDQEDSAIADQWAASEAKQDKLYRAILWLICAAEDKDLIAIVRRDATARERERNPDSAEVQTPSLFVKAARFGVSGLYRRKDKEKKMKELFKELVCEDLTIDTLEFYAEMRFKATTNPVTKKADVGGYNTTTNYVSALKTYWDVSTFYCDDRLQSNGVDVCVQERFGSANSTISAVKYTRLRAHILRRYRQRAEANDEPLENGAEALQKSDIEDIATALAGCMFSEKKQSEMAGLRFLVVLLWSVR